MGRSKTPTATELLRNIKEAEDFQEIDNWSENTKRMLSYLVGDYGVAMYSTKYIVNTIYNLINLIIPSLYFQNPYIRVKPAKKNFMKEIGEEAVMVDGYKRSVLVEHVLNQEIRKIHFEEEVRQVIQDALLCGFGVMKTGYSAKTIHDKDDYIDDGEVFAQRISPFNYLFDPMATSPEEARFEIYRHTETLKSVQDNKDYKNTEDLEGSTLAELNPKKKKKNDSKDDCKYIELYEYHDHEREKIYTIVKDCKKKRILKTQDEPYGFKHFTVLKFTGDNDSFRGISPVMMVEDEALAVNEVLSLAVNHLQKFAGVVMYEEGALDDDDLDRWERGEQGDVLMTQNGAMREGRIRRENPMSAGGEYYGNMNMLNGSIDRTLAITDFQRSSQSGKRKTASEVSIAAADANNRRAYFVSFVKKFIISNSEKILSLLQQFYDKKDWIEINGDFIEWLEWDKKEIQGDYYFDFDVEDLKTYTASRANALMQALQIMAPLEIFQPVWQKVDPYKLAEKIFKNLDLNLSSVTKKEDISHYEHDPYTENEFAEEGNRIPDPYPNEPHEHHISIHQPKMLEFAEDQEKLEELNRHVQMHTYWMQVSQSLPGSSPQPGGQQPQPQGPQGGQRIPSEPEATGGFTYNEDMQEKV